MLRQPCMESAFLVRLHCDPNHLPIGCVQMKDYVGYVLKLKTVRTWRVIEGLLIKAVEYLLEAASGSPEAKFPFNPWWANPSISGYAQVHRSLLAVRASALKA